MQQFHGQMNFLKNEMDRWQTGQFQRYYHCQWKERMQKVQSILQDYDMEADVIWKTYHLQGEYT